MKAFGYFCMVVAIIGLAAILTVPDDDVCKDQCSDHIIQAGGLGHLAGDVIYKVNNKIFYKTVENKVTGSTVAFGIFGTVIVMQ